MIEDEADIDWLNPQMVLCGEKLTVNVKTETGHFIPAQIRVLDVQPSRTGPGWDQIRVKFLEKWIAEKLNDRGEPFRTFYRFALHCLLK